MIGSIGKRLWDKRSVRVALALLALLAIACFLGPLLAAHTYHAQDAARSLQPPSAGFWFGTDSLGRDLFARVLAGGQLSLTVGVAAAVISLLLGALYGGVSALAGGRVDALLMRAADVLYALPTLLVAALFLLVLGRGPLAVVLALGLTSWVGEARLVRALVLQAKEMPYVESARSLGISSGRILAWHILPNVLGPVLVSVTFGIPQNILAESFLSFVGIGLEPPYASWGALASEGWRAFRTYPHLILFPGLALFFTVAVFTVLGDALRDALDPRAS